MSIAKKSKFKKTYSRYHLHLCEIYDDSGVFLKKTLLYFTKTIKDGYILFDPITEEKYVFNHIGNYYYNRDNDDYVHSIVRRINKTDVNPEQVYFTSNDIKKLNKKLCDTSKDE